MTVELYPFERGTIRCLKCESSDVALTYREQDHAGPERLALTCEECSFEWAMRCRPHGELLGGVPFPAHALVEAVRQVIDSRVEARRTRSLPGPRRKKR